MSTKKNTVDPESKLRQLLKQECNSRCADCGAPKPRYASIKLGTFLCNRCYGIHRSIGTHISRTKCVGLDNWNPQELEIMTSIGNATAAAYWEKNLPSGYIKPSSDSSDAVVEKWVRDKYERKLFCPADMAPPCGSRQQQNLDNVGVGYSSGQEQLSNDGWTPFVGADSAGSFSGVNPSSIVEAWNPFGDNTTQSISYTKGVFWRESVSPPTTDSSNFV